MAQRHISEGEIERTVIDADVEYADKAGNPIYVAHVDSRRIKVVVAKGSMPPHVITTGD